MADNSTPPPSIPEGKKIVERKRSDGTREWVVRDDSGCWIATAYYRDAYHRDVIKLRKMRNSLIYLPMVGPIVRKLNRAYYSIGRTRFASWWRDGLASNSVSGIRKGLSKIFLRTLLLFTGRNKAKE